MAIATINPATNETIKTFTALTTEEIELKLALADSTYQKYRQTSFAQRSQWLNNAADILERDPEKFGEIMTLEMGKPLKSAIAEVKKCAWVCRFYAEKAPEFLAEKSDRNRCYQQLCFLSTSGDYSRSDALEFSFLASISFCRTCFDGGQCRAIETCF